MLMTSGHWIPSVVGSCYKRAGCSVSESPLHCICKLLRADLRFEFLRFSTFKNVLKVIVGGWMEGGMQPNTETSCSSQELELLRPRPDPTV